MPNILTPSFDIQDIDHLKSDISKWKKWISEESQNEWDNFLLNELPNLQSTPTQPEEWYLDELIKIVNHRENALVNDSSSISLCNSTSREREECEVSMVCMLHVCIHVHFSCMHVL